MLDIFTRNVNLKRPAKVKKVRKEKELPRWVKIYIHYLKETFGWIFAAIIFIVATFAPLVPLCYLMARTADYPSRPVHNGWWFTLGFFILAIFWYTAAMAIYKSLQGSKNRWESRW